jgi:cystathionine beta-lyase
MPLSTARYGEEWRQALLAYLRGNRDLVEEALETCRELAITHVEAT